MKAAESYGATLDVAIVGCGKIADDHAQQIRRVPGARLVAACDCEALMAQQLGERFGIDQLFTDVDQMLDKARPRIVHITTPPATHFALGELCLQRGCHVYIEKPFALNTAETERLLALAEERSRLVTAGHDDQFRHAAVRLRNLVREGYLGEGPLHMESYYGYGLNVSDAYAKALLANPDHWVRKLPGGLLQNIISHGIARIAEYLTTDDPKVVAMGFTSPALRAQGEQRLVDELRVMIFDGDRATAFFTFSTQMRPSLHQFRVYGSRNGLALDQDHETVIRLPGKRHTSYLEQFLPPCHFARQYMGNLVRNLGLFWAHEFHAKAGLRTLIGRFYEAVRTGGPPPIPYREISLTSRIMDEIFAQLAAAQPPAAAPPAEAP